MIISQFNPLRGCDAFDLWNPRIPSTVNHITTSGRVKRVPKSKRPKVLKFRSFKESHPVTPPRGSRRGLPSSGGAGGGFQPRGAGGGIFLAAAPRNICSNPPFPINPKVQSTGTFMKIRNNELFVQKKLWFFVTKSNNY